MVWWVVAGAAALLLARPREVAGVIFKAGTNTAFRPEFARALPAIDRAHLRIVGRRAILTSGVRAPADRFSFHAVGLAGDFRTNDLPREKINPLVAELRRELGPDFDVVYESDLFEHRDGKQVQVRWQHIHIEHDPK